jgi:6-phosphofructokinase
MGRRFGNNAVELIRKGDFGYYVGVQRARLKKIPLKEIARSPALVDVQKYYDTERLNVKQQWTDGE